MQARECNSVSCLKLRNAVISWNDSRYQGISLR